MHAYFFKHRVPWKIKCQLGKPERNQGPSSVDSLGEETRDPTKQKNPQILSTIYSEPATTFLKVASREVGSTHTQGWEPARVTRCRPSVTPTFAAPTALSSTPSWRSYPGDCFSERCESAHIPVPFAVVAGGFSPLSFSRFLVHSSGDKVRVPYCPQCPSEHHNVMLENSGGAT